MISKEEKAGAAVVVALLVVGISGSAVVAALGPSPDIYVYSATAEPSTVIAGATAAGECVFTSNGHLVEIELADDAYAEHDVRAVKLLGTDARTVPSAAVEVGQSRSNGLCAPLGETTVVALDHTGTVVDRTTLTVTKEREVGVL